MSLPDVVLYDPHAPTVASPDDPGVLTLHAAQYAFVCAEARFSFYVGGIGAGKTFAGAVRAIRRGVEQPGSLGLVGAPTFPMLRDVTERAYFDLLPADLIARFSKTYHHLWLTNGSAVLFRSLDRPDRVRGLNLAWFWLDEAPLCGHYAWTLLKGRLRQRGYEPAGWATGTPKGRDGFARDFELAPLPGHALFRASTRANLRNLPPGYVEDLGYTGAFADQEIEGRFVAFDGLVYTFEAAQGGNVRTPAADTVFPRVIGGVDWGYTNPAAALVFGLDGDQRAWQLAEFYQRRAGLAEALLPALLELTRRHGVARWYCGPDEPEHIAALNDALAAERLPCRAVPAANAVVPGIQTITRLLAPRADGTRGLYVSPGCAATIAEYATYHYASAPVGGQRDPAEHPLKQGDHCCVAETLVLTEFGEQPIEAVTAGTRVLTRDGWCPVVAAGMTSPDAEKMRVTFSNGQELVGTPNHPAYVDSVGHTALHALRYGDKIVVADEVRKGLLLCSGRGSQIQARQLSTKALPFDGIRARVAGQTACTSRHQASIESRASVDSIRRSGKTLTGRCQRGTISITRTGTPSITRWRTLSACRDRSTTTTTCRF